MGQRIRHTVLGMLGVSVVVLAIPGLAEACLVQGTEASSTMRGAVPCLFHPVR